MTPPSSSFRLQSKPGMQLHNLRQQPHQDPHLSPTSIRNLVKQLATSGSTSTHSMNSTRRGRDLDASQAPKSTHRQPHKRQIRRRLHTARPYQDRLLNMAEARKEIVTALKFHRASMKQQEARQQPPTVPLLPLQNPCFQQDGGIMSLRNPRIYPSCTDNFSNLVADSSFHPTLSVPNPLNWPPAASPVAPPQMAENLGYKLPNRTLGLNLNFQNFDNLDAALYLNNNNASFYPCSYPSSSSPSLSVSTDQEVPSVAISQGEGTSALADAIDPIAATQVAGGKHTAMVDEGVGEIRSSALWPKFVKNMEHQATEEDAAHPVFDGPMEFPDWLSANERCFEQCSEDSTLDPNLPCMDIGDFEGMGEELLA